MGESDISTLFDVNQADSDKSILTEVLNENLNDLNFDGAYRTAGRLRNMNYDFYESTRPGIEWRKIDKAYQDAAAMLAKKGLMLNAFKAAALGGVDLRNVPGIGKNWQNYVTQLKEANVNLEFELGKLSPAEGQQIVGRLMEEVSRELHSYFKIPFGQRELVVGAPKLVYNNRNNITFFLMPQQRGEQPRIYIGRENLLDLSAYAEEFTHYFRWSFEKKSRQDVQELFGGLARLYFGGYFKMSNMDFDLERQYLGIQKEKQKIELTFEALNSAVDGSETDSFAVDLNTLERIYNKQMIKSAEHQIGYGVAQQIKDAGNLTGVMSIIGFIGQPDDVAMGEAKRFTVSPPRTSRTSFW